MGCSDMWLSMGFTFFSKFCFYNFIRCFLFLILFPVLLYWIGTDQYIVRKEKQLNILSQADWRLLTGRFKPSHKSSFQLIDPQYSLKKHIHLEKDTYKAFLKLRQDALKDGVSFFVISGTRTYTKQRTIWNIKLNRTQRRKNMFTPLQQVLHVLKFSAIPGLSRHHWGTDIDIVYSKKNYTLTNEYFIQSKKGKEAYQWLTQYAHTYGFCQPYKGRPKHRGKKRYLYGHQEEKWHWSYKPRSLGYMALFTKHIDHMAPKNFLGHQHVQIIYQDFVQNISSECL